MAAMKPRTGDGPLEVTKEGRGLVMRVPLEGGGRLVVELNQDEATELREALSRYVKAARKVGKSSQGRTAVRHTSDMDPKAVRAWAASNGYEVSNRGRLPAEVIEAFRAAGN